MRSIHDFVTVLQKLVKNLIPPNDEERAAAYLDEASDRIDLEMRMREVDRGHLRY